MDLDNNYRIVYDESNVILQFHEIRTRYPKDGDPVEYEFTEDTFHPNLEWALKSFVKKAVKYSASIDEVLVRLSELNKLISNLKLK